MTTATRRVGADPTSLELQELWFAMLRRRAWSSLVVVPAHAGGSAASLARGLAAVAERQLRRRVAFITPGQVSSLDEWPVHRTRRESIGQRGAVDFEAVITPPDHHLALAARGDATAGRSPVEPLVPTSALGPALGDRTERPGATAQVIVALEPVVSNPLGIAIALAADAALLCVTLGETPVVSARRTVEMIGRERFLGCVVVRSST